LGGWGIFNTRNAPIDAVTQNAQARGLSYSDISIKNLVLDEKLFLWHCVQVKRVSLRTNPEIFEASLWLNERFTKIRDEWPGFCFHFSLCHNGWDSISSDWQWHRKVNRPLFNFRIFAKPWEHQQMEKVAYWEAHDYLPRSLVPSIGWFKRKLSLFTQLHWNLEGLRIERLEESLGPITSGLRTSFPPHRSTEVTLLLSLHWARASDDVIQRIQ
jgi:hypothetical protein